MPKLRLLALIFVAIFTIAEPVAGQAKNDPQVEAGWDALEKGDGNRAAVAFEEALKRNPGDATLHFGAGAADYLLGRNGDAADKLNRALVLNPRLISATELLGEIDYLKGDLEGAIQRYEAALPFAGSLAPAMQQRLDRWQKEASVHRNLSRASNARFSVVFEDQ
jgi:tetratricopeptide (TPR) repeat protein